MSITSTVNKLLESLISIGLLLCVSKQIRNVTSVMAVGRFQSFICWKESSKVDSKNPSRTTSVILGIQSKDFGNKRTNVAIDQQNIARDWYVAQQGVLTSGYKSSWWISAVVSPGPRLLLATGNEVVDDGLRTIRKVTKLCLVSKAERAAPCWKEYAMYSD